MAAGSTTWWVGLDGWVLQDGNYTDFAVGERRQFALELGYRRSERLRATTSRTPACASAGRDATYDVVGEVVRAPSPDSRSTGLSDTFVVDVGIRAYAHHLVLDDLRPPRAGTWVTGEVLLSVDHFAYMDHHGRLPGMPPLIHTWTIEAIELDETPHIVVEPGHPLHAAPEREGPMRVRDLSRFAARPIERTRMWDDDGSYVLRCRLEPDPPAHSMARTGTRSPYGPVRS